MLSSSPAPMLPRLPPTAVRPAPVSTATLDLRSPPSMMASMSLTPSVELPKLRIPAQQQASADDTRRQSPGGYRAAPPVPVKTSVTTSTNMATTHGPSTRSPSSPSSFFQPDVTFGLTHLLEAAEQVRPPIPEITSPYGRSSPLKRQCPQPLPSIMQSLGGYPLEPPTIAKRARVGSDVGLDVQASYSLLGHMPRQSMVYPSIPQHQEHSQQVVVHPPIAAGSPTYAATSPVSRTDAPSVWDAVLTTGKFPVDICLSENGAGSASPTTSYNANNNRSQSMDAAEPAGVDSNFEVKQGRWSPDEEEYAQAMIQAVQRGDTVLPPNMSMRKFIADNLQCKTMRVSKKFRSLSAASQSSHALEQDDEPVTPRDDSFNPLSLKSIMNNDFVAPSLSSSDVRDVADVIDNTNFIRQSSGSKSGGTIKKVNQRVLKRSDYSQHGMVRSGRWSVEEENYAKAMIEAFKAGYLPLHGNVSLRKFLSEVLVCHPMRISKKFVGYVRKYHWYRIAAGKCDPEAKYQALNHLCHLERVFWTSLQQNSEWSASLRRDD
ncbi:hypothetical protein BBJ29_003501 [Phytophthora kernoviae]|uniref:Uncharacterized protein n=1 Tax=Phytophthora kernoviae TaxID=325452 RepID=A0A3F2RPZ9_9STRA|nr:hypothetical protein BBJ29_003501 [Phytophthora kernoviae]RLN61135.1 hypothetical protein BBP00_00005584 [Phytophthora kernoviae]